MCNAQLAHTIASPSSLCSGLFRKDGEERFNKSRCLCDTEVNSRWAVPLHCTLDKLDTPYSSLFLSFHCLCPIYLSPLCQFQLQTVWRGTTSMIQSTLIWSVMTTNPVFAMCMTQLSWRHKWYKNTHDTKCNRVMHKCKYEHQQRLLNGLTEHQIFPVFTSGSGSAVCTTQLTNSIAFYPELKVPLSVVVVFFFFSSSIQALVPMAPSVLSCQ